MPYIKDYQRARLEKEFETPDTSGELNFLITEILIQHTLKLGLNYSTINDVMGALESSKLEYYRRVAIPYENSKIKENGDVYPAEIAPLPSK